MPSIINATTTNGVVIQPDNSGSLQLATNNGTTAVTIDTSQNVGIGTSSPANKFEVFGNSVRNTARASSTAGAVQIEAQAFDYWSTQTYTGTSLLQYGSTATGTNVGLSNANLGALVFQNGSAGLIYTNGGVPIVFGTSNTERMRIDSSGNVLVGTTSSTTYGAASKASFYPTNSTNHQGISTGNWNSSGSAINFFSGIGGSVLYSGQISVSGSTTAYNTSSDYRLKENIVPMTGALDKVSKLKPVTYTWKTDGTSGQGFIAHELQEVVPDCVTGEKDAVDADGKPVYQGVDTSFLVATLTAAIQEQTQIINDLKARIETLEAK